MKFVSISRFQYFIEIISTALKNSKGGKTEKKKRERHKNTRAHTRKIYIYIRARTHGYIYIYTEYNTSRSRRLETGAFYITEHT